MINIMEYIIIALMAFILVIGPIALFFSIIMKGLA